MNEGVVPASGGEDGTMSLATGQQIDANTFDVSSFAADTQNNEMQGVLGKAKEASFVEKLLSFTLIVNLSRMPATAVKMVSSGFVAIKTSFGINFGCPSCEIIVEAIQDILDDPMAFHKSLSPFCPALHPNFLDQKVDTGFGFNDTSMPLDSGVGFTPSSTQSLYTTYQGASISGATAFDKATGNANHGIIDLDIISRSKILRHVEVLTQDYRMRRPKYRNSMCVERYRRRTFKERPSIDTRITKIYASSGLHLAGPGAVHSPPLWISYNSCASPIAEEPKGKLKLMCAWCEFSVDFTREMTTDKEIAKELLDKHVMDYHCDFITGREEYMQNVPDLFDDECWGSRTKHTSLDEVDPGDQFSGLKINYQQAKHPGMAVFERRKDSFLTFTTETTQSPDMLLEAGYFYASGDSDTVTCYMCGVVSSDWSMHETPWQRHARSSPTCQHVMSHKGQEFVRNTLEEYGEYRERKRENRIHNVTTRMLRPRMDSIVVQNALLIGIKRDHIKTVVSNRIMMGQNDFNRLEDLIRAVQDLLSARSVRTPSHPQPSRMICQPNDEDDSDKCATEVENCLPDFAEGVNIRELQNQLTCKVCLNEAVGIVFLPCGHFACCTSCAASMLNCPICRAAVNETIRANI